MNSFINNIYSADRINQSVAVLGGATAQSYGAVGLSKPSFDTENFSTVLDQVANVPAEGVTHDSHSRMSEAPNPVNSSSSLLSSLNSSSGSAFDESFESPDFSRTNEVRDSELISRFEATETESPAAFGLSSAQTVTAVDTETSAEGGAVSAGSTLLGFLEQVIAQAEASQAEFSGSFDGDRQSSIRDLIENFGSDTGSALRSALQDNVEGRGREFVADTFDASGLTLLEPIAEPVLAIDYYGESAVLINGALDLVVQPIGSFSLPPVGPTLTNAQNELASFAS